MTLLHLIRHGRASARDDNYDQLQPLGELQARLLGEHLRAHRRRFDAVYVGPHVRQRETERLMREAAGEVGAAWPAPIMLDGLAEGPFEPLMRHYIRPRLSNDPELAAIAQRIRGGADAAARDAALAEAFDHMITLWRAGEVAGGELESAAAFRARVVAACAEIVRREGYGRDVAVVTSNGVIGELLTQNAPPTKGAARQRLHNSSVSLLEFVPSGNSAVRAANLVEHLSLPEHFTLL